MGSGGGKNISNPISNPMDYLDPGGHLHKVQGGPTKGREIGATESAMMMVVDPVGSFKTTKNIAEGKNDPLHVPGPEGRALTGEDVRKQQRQLDAKKKAKYKELRDRGYQVIEPGTEEYEQYGSLLGSK